MFIIYREKGYIHLLQEKAPFWDWKLLAQFMTQAVIARSGSVGIA